MPVEVVFNPNALFWSYYYFSLVFPSVTFPSQFGCLINLVDSRLLNIWDTIALTFLLFTYLFLLAWNPKEIGWEDDSYFKSTKEFQFSLKKN